MRKTHSVQRYLICNPNFSFVFQYLWVDRKALLKTLEGFDGKKACWVPDDNEGFLQGEIVSSKGDDITVKINKTQEVRRDLQNSVTNNMFMDTK